jgi:outer membrane protein
MGGVGMVRVIGVGCRRVIVLLLGLGGLGAGQAFAEDLAEVYTISKNSDPRYKAARYEFEAATYAEPQARAALLPTLSFETTRSDTRQRILSSANPVFATGLSNYPSETQTLSLSQPVFKLSAWRQYQQAKSKVKQAAATFSAAEQDLMLRTATAYLNVLAARDALDFSTAERDAIRRQLDLVEQRFKSGIAAIASLHDATARHAVKEADLVSARNELDDRIQALRELTGKVMPNLKPLRDRIPLDQPSPADMDHWVDTALQQNLLLEARRQAVSVAQQEIQRQRAAHYPVLDLVANQNRRDTGGSLFGGGSNVETTDVMLRLNVPLFSGGLYSALTDEASKRYLGTLEDLERDARQVERQTRAAFQGVTGGVVRVQALAQGVVSSESARELKFQGFRAGIETLLQVLDAERDLYAAKRDSAKARYDFLLNRLRLKQAVGTLSEADLAAINALMQ